jgi:hypothetical protein
MLDLGMGERVMGGGENGHGRRHGYGHGQGSQKETMKQPEVAMKGKPTNPSLIRWSLLVGVNEKTASQRYGSLSLVCVPFLWWEEDLLTLRIGIHVSMKLHAKPRESYKLLPTEPRKLTHTSLSEEAMTVSNTPATCISSTLVHPLPSLSSFPFTSHSLAPFDVCSLPRVRINNSSSATHLSPVEATTSIS